VLDAKVSTSPLLTSARPVLSLAEVQAFYGKAQILFDLSLQVRKGHVVAIIGANGAGKSTTLNVIIGRLSNGPYHRTKCESPFRRRRAYRASLQRRLAPGPGPRDGCGQREPRK